MNRKPDSWGRGESCLLEIFSPWCTYFFPGDFVVQAKERPLEDRPSS